MTGVRDQAWEPGVAEAPVGSGEMAALIRAFDWASTPLGPVEGWSSSLRTTVTILLANRFPLLLWWGPDHVQLYNDAYRPVLGTKHPGSLGQPARDCWSEIWHIIGPLIEKPYTGGPATWDDDLFLELNRHGFLEETHFTVAYSPVPDDMVPSMIGGVLATVHEITQQVIQERRLAILRDLGARSADAKTAKEACEIAASVLERHPNDVPFALLYLAEGVEEGDRGQQTARLVASVGVPQAAPAVIDLAVEADSRTPWPLAEVMRTEQGEVVTDLSERLPMVPPGPWSDPPAQALVLPVPSSIPHRPAGVLVLGLSARLALDDAYRSFGTLVAGQIGTAIGNARAYEEERKRAEALTELDRAKTAFFSNVSHEFRTPLTLLLGPLREALAAPSDALVADTRPSLETAHRNSLRLLRLVNTLLDFARLEAGRVEASFEPTDLAALTADLASLFRSAIERAGLRLVVQCAPLPEPVHVDRDMWEKIVLNLLSNALKFTFAGDIVVTLRQAGETVKLAVRDTGTGIPAEELPHIFERFHRVRSARARTHEGTGIGLALVRELVALHGGTVGVESEVDGGTIVSVTLPLGTAHLPAERLGAARTLASTALGAAPYVEEALRWLPDAASDTIGPDEIITEEIDQSSGVAAPLARVLLADDNADMRAYLQRLLGGRYTVDAVADGFEALTAAQAELPDLVLADVMMPGLDGFALLRALRADPRTRTLPVILLSARAGEESIAEGLEAGADDYLVKPFASELLARVQAHLATARLRQKASDVVALERDWLQAEIVTLVRTEEELQRSHNHLRMALTATRTLAWEWNPHTDVITTSDNIIDMYGVANLGASAQGFSLVHPDDRSRHEATVRQAVEEAKSYESVFRIIRPDTGEVVWLEERGAPAVDAGGELLKLIGVTADVTERAQAEAHMRQQANLLALAHDAIIVRDPDGRILSWNDGATELYGWTAAEAVGKATHDLLQARVLPSGGPGAETDAILALHGVWDGDLEHTRRDGTRVVVESRQSLLRAADGAPEVILEVNRNATTREHLARLHSVTAALSAAATVHEVADVILKEGVATLASSVGVIALLTDDGSSFTTLRVVGYPAEVVTAWPGFAADASLPIADAVRAREPVILASLEERRARYPHLADVQPAGGGALVAIPLLVGVRPIGGLGLSFATARHFTREERAVMGALGQLCAQALERARLYEAEHRARAEAEATLERIADGVLIVDVAGRTIFLNETARRLLGVDVIGVPPERRSEVYGLLTPEGAPFVPEDLPTMRAMRERRAVTGVDMCIRRPDGTEIAVQENAGPIVTEDGSLVGAVATFRDMSAERELERQKEDFLSAVAHDFKNPIAVLQGQAQLLRRRIQRGSLDQEKVLQGLEMIEGRARMMAGLIDELVDVTRLRMGQTLPLTPTRVNLVDLVRKAVEAEQAIAEGHRFMLECDEDEILGFWDTTSLTRVLGNLLSNAIKYSARGSEIRVSVRRGERQGESSAVVAIRDHGVGIPAKDLPHVFDWFYRAENVADTVSGTGIGLAGARRIVEGHGGTIGVESREGVGSTFTVRLPLRLSDGAEETRTDRTE